MTDITKAAFLAGITCPTQGWYQLRLGGGPLDWQARWQFFQGQEVHRLAAEWVGGGEQLQRAGTEHAVEATATALAQGRHDRFLEATFASGGCVARADIVERQDGGWRIIEVKSGKAPEPGKDPSDEYLDDLAYTVMVARGAGLPVRSARLLLLDREYRAGAPEATLFAPVDVTADVFVRADAMAERAPALVPLLLGEAAPSAILIPACKDCSYFSDPCIGREIPDPIFLLPRLSAKRFEALAPYRRIAHLPLDADLTDTQRVIFEVLRTGRPWMDPNVLAALDAVTWPAWYLDFEAVMPALPWHEGDGPYATTLSQYSLHRVDRRGADPVHWEYLAELGRDWRRDLLEAMLDALGDRGSIIVYSSYERMRLREAGERFPDLEERLAAIRERLFDLEPFFRKGYLHPGFRGRSSIKYTLPVMVPGLGYDGMAVGNGSDAAGLVSLMKRGQVPEAEHPKHRQALLEYCRMDTLAMVELHRALLEVRPR